MFLFFERASVKTQRVLTAIIAVLSTFIAVFLAIGISREFSQQPSAISSSRLLWIVAVAMVTAIIVAGVTFALSTTFSEVQQKFEEQARIQENLQAELTRLQHTLEEQKIGKEDLQTKITRLEEVLEKAVEENQALAEKITQENRDLDEPEGEIGNFIAHMQMEFQEPAQSIASLTSSSLEEIRQYKDELEYRIVWLRTLLEDAEKELKLICIAYEL